MQGERGREEGKIESLLILEVQAKKKSTSFITHETLDNNSIINILIVNSVEM